MANHIAVGFSLWWYSDGSTDSVTIDLRFHPVSYFFPAYAAYRTTIAPETSKQFNIEKQVPVDFVIGQYDVSTYEGEVYSYFTPTSNTGYSLDGYKLTVTDSVGSANTLNEVVGILLF